MEPTAAFVSSFAGARATSRQLPAISSSSAPRRLSRRVTPMSMASTPKVPYKAPGAQGYEFIDIYQRLYRDRILFINQDLDIELSNQMIATLLYLDSEDPEAPVTIYFNTAGGETNAGLAIFDAMEAMRFPVQTLNLGLCAHMGAFLVGAGTKGMRMALPNSRFLLQAPIMQDTYRGPASDVDIEVTEVLRQRKRVISGFSKFTGKSEEQLKTDMDRDMYLTAFEARDYGLIDAVLLPRTEGPSKNFVAGLGS